MVLLVIVTKKEELFHVYVNPESSWNTAKGAEQVGLKAYVYESGSGLFTEVGEYGWRHCRNPPEIVKMTQMLY
ncbi:hypothetical protein HOT57_gp48 [Pseudomonas phage phCDa]|uniref:Uncharacterized protein n=1 Tax=Pseudomonas phage phCDa TaxID=2268587 RepID=A0A2Z5HAF5_9CAUD|nr:hypothetical protein HOT57_gp48 [Pseudomonas phage phCDa]AXC36492.1 hypothetical protein phCDa_48 [Pseudomonas phage phCDa]